MGRLKVRDGWKGHKFVMHRCMDALGAPTKFASNTQGDGNSLFKNNSVSVDLFMLT